MAPRLLTKRPHPTGLHNPAGTFELRDLVKHYPNKSEVVRAVDGVWLKIQAGELVALYGPSGCGKSTLLQLAAGLIRPDSGNIIFDGRDITKMSGRQSTIYRRRDVGFVFQAFHLMPGCTALENALIKLPINGYTKREAQEKTIPWLQRLGLGDRIESLPGELSMGQRQRVAIARALVGKPRLLLADEPTGNLDSKRTREILALLRDICHETRIPGLLVTHDPDAIPFCDRTVNLRNGKLHEGDGVNQLAMIAA